ncbi:hypothetical protein CEXT_693981 [Caerostris extrusa]|uniref:Uncharacterized protein n=1 Tax=Caerostris extrusa TaxID=172846 RepID=A0AAV4PJV8_CAEEX|nr:hypothetical protein CEXT_693981 [Caerostris extrusa]
MACKSGFERKTPQKISRHPLERSDLNIVYVFVVGDKSTGKTTLINSLTTRRISDPLLPSFQYVSEYNHMTDVGLITLRLLELNREQLSLPEILQVCQAAKHVFLFVYAIDDLVGFQCFYTKWIMYVRRAFGWTAATVMLGNKIDLKNDPNFKINNPDYNDTLSHYNKKLFNVDCAFECSVLTGDQVDSVFCKIAMLGNETRPLRKQLTLEEHFKILDKSKKLMLI